MMSRTAEFGGNSAQPSEHSDPRNDWSGKTLGQFLSRGSQVRILPGACENPANPGFSAGRAGTSGRTCPHRVPRLPAPVGSIAARSTERNGGRRRCRSVAVPIDSLTDCPAPRTRGRTCPASAAISAALPFASRAPTARRCGRRWAHPECRNHAGPVAWAEADRTVAFACRSDSAGSVLLNDRRSSGAQASYASVDTPALPGWLLRKAR
jgi:hypothetical protein